MKTATRTKQVNVGLPEPLYNDIKALAEATHRSMVGTIAWLYAEQTEREAAPATAREDGKEQPQTSVSANGPS